MNKKQRRLAQFLSITVIAFLVIALVVTAVAPY